MLVRAVLTDIEGTTTSLSFVRETLFPWARARLEQFVAAHASRPDIAAVLDEARALEGAPALELAGTIALLCRWSDEDRKAPPLKTLQGILWQEGYASGAYRGHLYEDVAPALRRWHQAGIHSTSSLPARSPRSSSSFDIPSPAI